jgi:hypothetical protein
VYDPTERLFDEVLLFGCWWGLWRILVVWRLREDLGLLVLVVHMIGLVKDWFVVELLLVVLLGMVSMRDNSLVVGWLILWPFCLWCPWFRGNPWWGVRSIHRERGSRTFAAAKPDLCLFL